MPSDPNSPDPRSLLKDPTRVVQDDVRIETLDFDAAYPPLPPERDEYLRTRTVVEGGDGSGVLHVGAIIDGYRLRRQIGRGGMGVVYEAEQLSLGRTVALKVMPPGLVRNARAIDRFKREATAVARLSHPRIVAVHGFNIAEGIAYLAMEFIDGLDMGEIIDRLKTARTHGRRFVRISGPELEKDMAEWAQGRKLIGTVPGDPRIAEGIVIDLRNPFLMDAAIAADAADALRHAHAHGVIHRDIKPSNLILARDGRIKLSDFGLAKSTDAGSLTETGDFVGSPAYVSPEQASSRRVRVDERTDIYSLGVTLYELVTLHQPFAGKNVAVILKQILTRDPPPPTKVNPRVPKDLETIILKAIEKDPGRRYQSAEELGDDLRRFLNFEAIQARPLGPFARTLRAIRQNRVAVALSSMGVAIVALLGIVAAGAALWRTDDDVARQVQEFLETRGPDTVDDLRLVRELTAEVSPSQRRQSIERIAEEAQRRLDEGDYEALIRLLDQLGAGANMAGWSDLDRQLLAVCTADIKNDLVRRLRGMLNQPGGDPRRRQRWIGALHRLLLDPDWHVCKNAALALGRVASDTSLGALLSALVDRGDGPGRVAILAALRDFGHLEAVPLVAVELEDPDPDVRYAALDALDGLDPEGLTEWLAPLEYERIPWITHRYDGVLARLRDAQRVEEGEG